MGVVYKGFDTTLRRVVALKVMNPAIAYAPDVRARFLREARTAAQLNHPNIVGIYDIDLEYTPAYLVMEYVQGCSLSTRIGELGRLPLESALAIARELLAGLGEAHRSGLIHRDVKPSNVLLEADGGRAKLVDFGLARGIDDSTRFTTAGDVVGTLWYMSPEQAEGKTELDFRCDLYAVGVVLFEMLTGTVPFADRNKVRTLDAIVRQPPPDVRQLNEALPARIAKIIRKALSKDPRRRYESAEHFAEALALDSAPPPAAVPRTASGA